MNQLLERCKTSGIVVLLLATALLTLAGCGNHQVQAADQLPEGTPTAIQPGSLGGATAAAQVPGYLSPQPGAVLNTTTPSFVWTTIGGAKGYEVQISTDQHFPSGKTISSGVVGQPPWTDTAELTAGDTYYWRIRGIYQSAAPGPWSDYSPFSLAPAPTPTPGAAPGITVTPGEPGVTVASLAIWDATTQVLLTTPGRSLGDVLKSLQQGRVYEFAATLDMVVRPSDFGIDHPPIYLVGGKEQLVFW